MKPEQNRLIQELSQPASEGIITRLSASKKIQKSETIAEIVR
jgi:hypothetical protein